MPETPNMKLREPPAPPPTAAIGPAAHAYAELDVATNFSFLRGASHPDELVFRAAELGYRAIAIADRNSLAGVVRAHDAVRQVNEQGGVPPRLVIGARLTFADPDAPDVLVYPTDRAAYARLCRLLTLGKRRTIKGECLLYLRDLLDQHHGLLAVVCGTTILPVSEAAGQRPSALPRTRHKQDAREMGHALRLAPKSPLALLRETFGRDRLSLAASALFGGDDCSRLAYFADLARELDVPLVATNHVHYHDASRRRLQDVLTCVRHGCTIDQAGYRLFPNDQRHLKEPGQMHRLFADHPGAIRRGLEVAERCAFSLDELRYEYPHELVPAGETPTQYLRRLAYEGAAARYADRRDADVELASASGISRRREASSSPDAVRDDVPLAEASPAKAPADLAAVPEKVRRQLEHELALIERLQFEPYFLTVYDTVRFARSRGILCQGRGSAANSAVCYCLGVTSVDPTQIDILFERFLSDARNEPPDIDVDFEHERREEVLQYLYEKYGRERAGMTAVVITYRGRSAVRDVGKALGLSLDMVDQMAKKLDWWHRGTVTGEMLTACGLDPADRTIARVVELTAQLLGFPRHLSQHVGGMVMTRGPLCELVPIENAAMEGRTVIEWDKDDIDTLGIMKVDALALGMLTAISKALSMVNAQHARYPAGWGSSVAPPGLTSSADSTRGSRPGLHSDAAPRLKTHPRYELHTVPQEDPLVYDMICDADTIGVFQIESRAQMTMLPRLRPRNFYDLVIEVAIVRPGPIQGDMVHPYLRRRNGEEKVSYPSEALRDVLHKTLGVPLFQEQAMKIAMVGAGFSAAEADQLRRAMAAWKKTGALEKFHPKIINGMLANGYTREFAEQCFNQIRGFGEYGFPESHAASFALLVYVSAWLKRHHPAAFAAALLNSQPMGFYAPAQLVRDAREHGVEVRPADVNESGWDCTLAESDGATERRSDEGLREEGCSVSSPPSLARPKVTWGLTGPALRLGLRLIKGLRQDHANQITEARAKLGRFTSIAQLHRATALPAHALRRLAEADAFTSLGLTRRQAVWETLELKDEHFPLFDQLEESDRATKRPSDEGEANVIAGPSSLGRSVAPSLLPPMPLGQEVMTDYATTSLSLKKHLVALLRDHFRSLKITPARDIAHTPAGRWVKVAGLVLIRQRPGTASGIVFETLEDETGVINLIIRPDVFDRYRPAARHAGLLQADGYVERQGQVIHVMAKRLFDLSHLLSGFQLTSRDFH